MSGDWIKMRVNLSTDPAVIAIADACDMDEDHIVGKLHRFWSWADQQTEEGDAPSVTKKWVDRYLSAAGFADAMVSAGWLEETPEGLRIPNFDAHNGQSAKKRGLTAKRNTRYRAKNSEKRDAPNVTRKSSSASPREEKSRDKRKPLTPLEIPARLNTPHFLAAWADWETYRRETKKKLTPMAIKKQFKLLAQFPPATAVEMLESSMRNQYTGIFAPKPQQNMPPRNDAAASQEAIAKAMEGVV